MKNLTNAIVVRLLASLILVICAKGAFSQDEPRVSCALDKVGPTFLVLVQKSDFEKLSGDEEAFLRSMEVIPSEQAFNGFIDLDTGPMEQDVTKRCCTYNHVTFGDCASTYKRHCYECDDAAVQKILDICSAGASTAFEIDEEFEVLLAPKDLDRLTKSPVEFIRSLNVVPSDHEINGLMSLIDLTKLEKNEWHVQKWCHIKKGKCKSNYLVCTSSSVRSPRFKK